MSTAMAINATKRMLPSIGSRVRIRARLHISSALKATLVSSSTLLSLRSMAIFTNCQSRSATRRTMMASSTPCRALVIKLSPAATAARSRSKARASSSAAMITSMARTLRSTNMAWVRACRDVLVPGSDGRRRWPIARRARMIAIGRLAATIRHHAAAWAPARNSRPISGNRMVAKTGSSARACNRAAVSGTSAGRDGSGASGKRRPDQVTQTAAATSRTPKPCAVSTAVGSDTPRRSTIDAVAQPKAAIEARMPSQRCQKRAAGVLMGRSRKRSTSGASAKRPNTNASRTSTTAIR